MAKRTRPRASMTAPSQTSTASGSTQTSNQSQSQSSSISSQSQSSKSQLLEKQLKLMTSQLSEMSSQLETERAELESVRKDLEFGEKHARMQLHNFTETVKIKHQKEQELSRWEDLKAQMDENNRLLAEQIYQWQIDYANNEDELGGLHIKNTLLQAERGNLRKQRSRLQHRVQELETNVTAARRKIERLVSDMSKLQEQLKKSTGVIAANTQELKAQRKRDAWQRIVLAFAVGAALLQSSVLVANRIAAADAASRAVWVFVALMVLVAVVVLILAGTTGVTALRDMYRHEMTPFKPVKKNKSDKEEKK